MHVSEVLRAAALGYLVGTISTADIVSRRAIGGPVDLRNVGSHNPGAANAMKVLGAKAGAVVMVGDIVKGAAACALGALVAGGSGAHAAGTACVVGHCYPVWNGFRGGKGVAAGVGQCLATFPAYFGVDLAIAAATVAVPQLKRRALFSTAVCSAAWIIGAITWWRKRWPNLWGPVPGPGLVAGATASSAVVMYRFARAGSQPADALETMPRRAA